MKHVKWILQNMLVASVSREGPRVLTQKQQHNKLELSKTRDWIPLRRTWGSQTSRWVKRILLRTKEKLILRSTILWLNKIEFQFTRAWSSLHGCWTTKMWLVGCRARRIARFGGGGDPQVGADCCLLAAAMWLVECRSSRFPPCRRTERTCRGGLTEGCN